MIRAGDTVTEVEAEALERIRMALSSMPFGGTVYGALHTETLDDLARNAELLRSYLSEHIAPDYNRRGDELARYKSALGAVRWLITETTDET